MPTQKRNDELVGILKADFQARYEPNFAWKSAVSSFLALPGLRAAWPMSSVAYVQPECLDVSGNANHLQAAAALGNVTFGYDTTPSLVPVAVFGGGANQYLFRADGGAASWADILGTETYIQAAQRGLTLGGWFWIDNYATLMFLMAKDNNAGFRPYTLFSNAATQVITFRAGTGAAISAVNSAAQSARTWLFIVGRFVPSTTLDIYVNNTKTSNPTAIAALLDGADNFTIGEASGGGAWPFTGRAAMCFLCAAALSDSIITSLFHQTRAMFNV